MPRRSILDRTDVLMQVAELSAEGLHLSDIAVIVGCDPDTIARWHEQGRVDIANGRKNSKYARLYYAVEKNRSEHYRSVMGDLKRQSKAGNDRASKILLEQSPNYRHDTNVNVTVTAAKLKEMTIEELLRLRSGDTTPLLEDTGTRNPL